MLKMDDNIADDAKHHKAESLSLQVANEELEAESLDIDAQEMAFTGHNDDQGPREVGS